jgi:hypothetical protein
VVHSLDAVDCPEKPRSPARIGATLAARGIRLVVLHHAREPAPGGLGARVLPSRPHRRPRPVNGFDRRPAR